MNQEKIGNFICKLRKESKLTQGKLASKLNVNVKSISRWENGKNLPDHSLIVQICDLFSISINEFYNGSKVNKKVFSLYYLAISFINFLLLPCLIIVAPTLVLSGMIIPIMGLVNLVGFLFKASTSFIVFRIGNLVLNPIIGFVLSIIIGAIMFIGGIYLFVLLKKYIHYIKEKMASIYD